MSERVWLTWETQRRNRTLSSKLNADLYEITADGPRWKRYPSLILRTLKILFNTKPSFVFSQNPSLLLAAIAVTYGKISNSTVIVDAHNAGIFPLEGRSAALVRIAAFINSLSSKVIVSNTSLIKHVRKHDNDVYAIPDPIPVINKHSLYPVRNDAFNIAFVCSWADDEPLEEVFHAASNLTGFANLYVTGKSGGKEQSFVTSLPANVILTGFLSEEEYEDLLIACDAIMVLTTRDDCLVCGAYEGVAVEKPMILSNTDALIKHFNKGCMYTDNTAIDIERKVRDLCQAHTMLEEEIKSLKVDKQIEIDKTLEIFNKSI